MFRARVMLLVSVNAAAAFSPAAAFNPACTQQQSRVYPRLVRESTTGVLKSSRHGIDNRPAGTLASQSALSKIKMSSAEEDSFADFEQSLLADLNAFEEEQKELLDDLLDAFGEGDAATTATTAAPQTVSTQAAPDLNFHSDAEKQAYWNDVEARWNDFSKESLHQAYLRHSSFHSVQAMANPTATFDTTMGSFEAEIYLDRVPITASSFIDLAKTGFYNGIHFHRVIPGFMNQFGCPNAKDPKSPRAGTGGPPDGAFKNLKTGATEKRSNGGNIKDENISRDTNERGTLSMANTGQPNSGGSQFFINVAHNDFLDWFSPGDSKHPVFGKITKGMDIVIKISKVPTNNDNPRTPIMMNSVTITGV